MRIVSIPTFGYASNSYLLASDNEGAVVDPSAEINEYIISATNEGVSIKYIILTHVHFDHILTLSDLRERTGAKLCVQRLEELSLSTPSRSLFTMIGEPNRTFDKADILLEDGSIIKLGNEELKVRYTPGHTIGSIMLVCGDDIITGDTLFDMSVGRCDFPTGDPDALLDSIYKLYDEFPNARIYPGHGGISTVDKQIKNNPFTKWR